MPNRKIERVTAKLAGASSAETFDIYDSIAVHRYETVASMVADTDLKADEICKTAGYNSKNDGGGAFYIISSASVSGKYNIALSNGSYATMVREDVIVPEQFGAYGNGTNDDTGGLRACFAMGGNIHLPKGKTYIFSSYVPIVSNSIIRFDATLTATAVADTSLEFFDRVTGAAGYTGVHDVILYGEGLINMRGDTMSNGYASPIRIYHCSNIRIEGITIKNYSKFHAMEIGGTDGAVIDGVKFLGCYPNGDDGNHETIQIEGITESGSAGAIPYDGTLSKNITIKNCVFKDSEEAGLTYTSIGAHQQLNDSTWAKYFENITIENNTFINSRRPAIYFDSNFKNVRIINNLFKDSVNQHPVLRFDYYMDGITIADNVFENVAYEVIWLGQNISPSTDSTKNLKNIYFCNNTIDGYNSLGVNTAAGVDIQAITEDVTVLNNVFKFDATKSNRPVFLNAAFQTATYTKNLIVENNVYNGRIVSKNDRYFYYGGAASSITQFLQDRFAYFMNNIGYVTPIVNPVGNDNRNVYFIFGPKDGTADMCSIVFYNAASSRATMLTIPQVPNVARLIVTSYSGGSYSHYQIALTSFTG